MYSQKLKSNYLNLNLLSIGQYSFYIGIFFLCSALPIAAIFLLFSTFIAIFKFKRKFFIDKFNNIFYLISVLLIASTVYKSIFSDFNDLENYELINNWVSLINWLPFFVFFRASQFYLKKSDQRDRFIKVLIAGSFPLFFSIISQFHFNHFGPFSTLNGLITWFQKPLNLENRSANVGVAGLFSNPNYTAYWLATILPLTFYLSTIKKNEILKRILKLLLSSCIIYFLILTDSRNGILGIFITLYFLIGFKIILILAFSLGLFLIIYFLFKPSLPIQMVFFLESIFQRSLFLKITNIDFSNFRLFTRVDLFYKTIVLIFQKPIFGWLAGSFSSIFLLKNGFLYIQHTHNLFLQVAFDYGLAPSILFFSTITYLIITSYFKIFCEDKNNNLAKAWFTASFVSVIFNFFDIPYFDGKVSILFWSYLAGLKSYLEEE